MHRATGRRPHTGWAASTLALALALVCHGAAAEGGNLHLRLRAGAWSGDRQLDERRDVAVANLWVDAFQPLGDDAALKFEGWLRRQSTGTSVDRRWRPREAYLRLDRDALQWRLGWQVFAWGRADRINPTDNVSARDYRSLVSQDEEQRFGSPAAALTWQVSGPWQLTALVKGFDASVLPSAAAEAGLPLARDATGRAEWGLRLDRSGEGVDGSVSLFRGHDKQRGLALSADGHGLQREHARSTVLGADLALVHGAWNFRTEWAATRLDDNAPRQRFGKQGSLFGVLGAERSLADASSVNLQWFVRRLGHALPQTPADPLAAALASVAAIGNGQTVRTSQGLSLRYSQRLMNDSLDYELVALFGFRAGDSALRPRLNLQLNDTLRATVGADVFRGPASSPYGSLRRNSAVFVELSCAI